MRSLLDVLTLSDEYLKKKRIQNSRREAEKLLCDFFQCSRIALYTQFDRPLTESELELCREKLQRRGEGEPIGYIHGEVEFFHCKIKVDSAVLIPRQETEVLVSRIVGELESKNLEGKVLWDLCSGSGCIGIAIKKRFPELTVVLSDISEEALKKAKENALFNCVEVSFVKGDLLAPFKGNKADFLVCNPPYVSEVEYATLEREVQAFEPKLALVSGSSGLEFYQRLAKELSFYINRGGKAWFELGSGQGKAVKELFSNFSADFEQDWSGHDRFFFLVFE